MSNNRAADHDTFRRQLAAGDSVASIVDCLRKMRAEGLADNEIAGLQASREERKGSRFGCTSLVHLSSGVNFAARIQLSRCVAK